MFVDFFGLFWFVWIESYCNNCFQDLLRFAFVLFGEARSCNSLRIIAFEIVSLRDLCSLGFPGFLGLLRDSWDLNIRGSGNPVRAVRSLYLFRSPGCEMAFRNLLKSLLTHFCVFAAKLGPRHVWNFFLSISGSWAPNKFQEVSGNSFYASRGPGCQMVSDIIIKLLSKFLGPGCQIACGIEFCACLGRACKWPSGNLWNIIICISGSWQPNAFHEFFGSLFYVNIFYVLRQFP